MGTVDDALQSLDYLDQCGHVGDFMKGWSLQLGQQGADLLFGNAVQNCFHASQTSCGGFQHIEDLLLLLDVPHQVRLVGMAVLAKHPTVKLDAYRVFEGWQCVGLTLIRSGIARRFLPANTVLRTTVGAAAMAEFDRELFIIQLVSKKGGLDREFKPSVLM